MSGPIEALLVDRAVPSAAFEGAQRAGRALARYCVGEALYMRMLPRVCPEALQPEDSIEGAIQRAARAWPSPAEAPRRFQASLQFLGTALQRVLRTHALPEAPAPSHTGLLYLEGPGAADGTRAVTGLDPTSLAAQLFGPWRAENRLVIIGGSLEAAGLEPPQLSPTWSAGIDEPVLLIDFYAELPPAPWT